MIPSSSKKSRKARSKITKIYHPHDIVQEIEEIHSMLASNQVSIPDNWFWHRDRINALKKLEKTMLRRISELEKSFIKKIAARTGIEKARDIIRNPKYQDEPVVQTHLKIAELLSQYLEKLGEALDDLNIGNIPSKEIQGGKSAEINWILHQIDILLEKEIGTYTLIIQENETKERYSELLNSLSYPVDKNPELTQFLINNWVEVAVLTFTVFSPL